jgi:predicted ATPase
VRDARQFLLSSDTPDDAAAARARNKQRLKLEDILDVDNMEMFKGQFGRRLKSSIEAGLPVQLTLTEQLSQLIKRLAALDRYERATLARRKKAIRVFDAMHWQSSASHKSARRRQKSYKTKPN